MKRKISPMDLDRLIQDYMAKPLGGEDEAIDVDELVEDEFEVVLDDESIIDDPTDNDSVDDARKKAPR